MRKALLILSVLFAVPLFAQQSTEKFRFSVFATDIGFTHSESVGTDWSGGLGAALEYRWNQQWSLELQIASEEHTITTAVLEQNGIYFIDRREARFYPIDLLAHYEFANSSRWKPFLGAGVRYVRSPDSNYVDRTTFEIDGGVHYMITPALSLRMDAKQLISSDGRAFDHGLKPSIGLGFRF